MHISPTPCFLPESNFCSVSVQGISFICLRTELQEFKRDPEQPLKKENFIFWTVAVLLLPTTLLFVRVLSKKTPFNLEVSEKYTDCKALEVISVLYCATFRVIIVCNCNVKIAKNLGCKCIPYGAHITSIQSFMKHVQSLHFFRGHMLEGHGHSNSYFLLSCHANVFFQGCILNPKVEFVDEKQKVKFLLVEIEKNVH